MIKKPHLDHTQALSSYVSGSLGTLKKCFYGLEIFSNPLIDFITKRSNKSRRLEAFNMISRYGSGLFVGAYYIRNVIYIQGGWEQKVKDLSDYTLDKSKKYEIEVFFNYVSAKIVEKDPYFGLKTQEGFLKESIQKITHKYVSQIYYKKLLVENVSGVLSLYHGYFYGNINYFNEAIITIISTKRALKRL